MSLMQLHDESHAGKGRNLITVLINWHTESPSYCSACKHVFWSLWATWFVNLVNLLIVHTAEPSPWIIHCESLVDTDCRVFFPLRCTTECPERRCFPCTDGYGGWGLTAAPSPAPFLRFQLFWTSSSCCFCSGLCQTGSWTWPLTPPALTDSGDRNRAVKPAARSKQQNRIFHDHSTALPRF